MTSVSYRTKSHDGRRRPAEDLSVVRKSHLSPPTTTVERLLLMTTILVVALEIYLPSVARFSPSFFAFAMLAGYVLLCRPGILAKTWSHPVFLAAYGLLILGALIESVHPLSHYGQLSRTGQMFVGAIFVASLCRDRHALRTSIYGFLGAGVLISMLLFLTVYGVLQQGTATDFSEASRLRGQAMGDLPREMMTIFLPIAAAMALALGLKAISSARRNLFLGISLFCVVGTFLPMSRGRIVMVGAACATVLLAYGIQHVKVILIAAVLVLGALIWVPEAVFSRLTFTPETASGKPDIRRRIYKAALDHLPDYFLTGVGAGNFWGPWGMQSSYFQYQTAHSPGRTGGAHNAFIQVTVYWGLAALLMLLMVVYLTYHCFPRGGGKDVLVLCLYGLAVCLLIQMMVAHGLASKAYSLGLGLIVGSRLWIWPKFNVLPLRRDQRRRHRILEHAS